MKLLGKIPESKLVRYGDIKPGQCYTIYGRVEIRGDWRDERDGNFTSIDLATGKVYGGHDSLLVEPLLVEAHIIEEKK